MEARALETSADSQNDDTSFSQKHLKIGEEEKGRPYFNIGKTIPRISGISHASEIVA